MAVYIRLPLRQNSIDTEKSTKMIFSWADSYSDALEPARVETLRCRMTVMLYQQLYRKNHPDSTCAHKVSIPCLKIQLSQMYQIASKRVSIKIVAFGHSGLLTSPQNDKSQIETCLRNELDQLYFYGNVITCRTKRTEDFFTFTYF